MRTVTSIFALLATTALSTGVVHAQAVPNTTVSNDNVVNLLAPFLNLNATPIGQQTLTTNLSQSIATNNNATPALQALSVSDKNLFGNRVNTITLSNGMTATYGIAANLAGGLPAQAAVNPSAGAVTTTPTTPVQAVGGLGAVLGPIFQTGVMPTTNSNATASAVLANTATLLNTAYTNFTSIDLGVAKNYFADGAASNSSGSAATSTAAVAAAGQTLPTANGYPNTVTSVYDTAYGVTNTQANQDVYGSSRPVQVAPMATMTSPGINQFDSSSIAGLTTNPSFPSGHTTYAYTDSILIGMLVPQDYQSMLLRASAYANSRIVLGVHYPLDIIGSRALASYDLAQAFTNAAYQNGTNTTTSFNLATQYNAAKPEIQNYLTMQGNLQGCGATIAACSTSAANTANDPYVPSSANAATYIANLTYGLPTLTLAQAPQEAAPAGGPDASILLAPLYGGSTTAAMTIAPTGGIDGRLGTATINQIIVSTENVALSAFYGTSLSYWTRINLYAAGGYFSNVTGTLSLATTDVVTTPVTIASGGVLYDNGTITGTAAAGGNPATPGSTLVSAGGQLSGTGTATNVTIAAGGILAPGTATTMGTTNIAGTLTFAPGANYNIRVTPTATDSTIVTGTAALSGAVNVALAPGVYQPTTQYTILTTTGGPGTITGAFASVNTNSAFIAGSTTIVGDPTVVLTLLALPYSVVAQTSNQNNVGVGLTNGSQQPLSANGAAIIANLQAIPTAAQARATLNSLSGEGITAAQNAAHRAVSEFTSSITDQTTFYGSGQGAANSITLTSGLPSGVLGYAAPQRELADFPIRPRDPVAPIAAPRTWRAWATGFGGAEDIHGNAILGAAEQTSTVLGGSLGVDYQMMPGYLAGIAVGGSDGEFQVANRATSGSTTGGHIAFYDLATFGSFYGASVNTASFFGNKTSRFVAGFGALAGENDRGSFSSHEFRTRLEVGRHFGAYGGIVTPFIALELAELRSDGFNETNLGGPTVLGLNVQGQSSASVPSFIGARYQGVTSLGNGLRITPSLQAAYVHEFAPQRQQFGQFISLPGSVFLVDGARPSRDAAQVKAGAELAIGPQSTLFATFDGEFSGQATFYGGKGGFKYVW